MIARREGEIGNLLAEGSLRAARQFGQGSEAYAMQVKGLEVAAYNCKFIPGMALAFGVSPIGAHHKESWVITFELKQTSRESYGPEKAQKVIDLQRIRGGLFEYIVACRFPWIELGWSLENYPKYFKLVSGLDWTLDDFWTVSDRDLLPDQALLAPGVPARPTGSSTIRRPSGSTRPTSTPKALSPASTSNTTSMTACSSITTTSAAMTSAASRPKPPWNGWGSPQRAKRGRRIRSLTQMKSRSS